MTEKEWHPSDDVPAMLQALSSNWSGAETDLARLTHRYLLACCRSIWWLLPLEASRRGGEVAERFLDGFATRKELGQASYQAEGAAFYLETFEYQPEHEDPREQRRPLTVRCRKKSLH